MGLTDYFRPRKASVSAAHVGLPTLTSPSEQSPLSSAPSTGGPAYGQARGSLFPDEVKYEVILNHLFQKQCSALWINDISGELEGTIIRKRKNEYMAVPPALVHSNFTEAMAALNVQTAMTVRSRVISTFLTWSPNQDDIPLPNGLRIQVVATVSDLARARKPQYAAFVASESLLVVESIEAQLLRLVWQRTDGGADEKVIASEKHGAVVRQVQYDEETGVPESDVRPTLYYNAIQVAFSICLVITLLGLGYQRIAQEVTLVNKWTSLAFIALTPVNIFFSLFFAGIIISVIAQIIGPVSQLTKNSKFYSAQPPRRLHGRALPHVTIQCPVYKEGLEGVIQPTMRSIMAAVSTYELQGGTANIFVNDDGLQIISEADRMARIDYYADNDIGWTARPKHGEDGFVRKGKFKKASNMNYGLILSNAVEERLQNVQRSEHWTSDDETRAYQETLQEVLKEDNRAWASGNIRVGDYILLIDSDTRVPADCFLDAVSEMEQSPDVAIIQFSSGVMQVAHDFFENGIAFFTGVIYSAIRFGVAGGDVAAFVGHNAILRWSAIQECAFLDSDGNERFWSEDHVSEDFDMALRLQVDGYIVRMAGWAGDGFKEGVSLTVYDELTRWEKYAYGCNELVFNPILTWWRKGPFTPLFRRFVASCMPLGSKINIIAYIGTYYAIGSAWIYTTANYIAVGLFNGYLDKWYVESWQIWLSIIIVFSVAGNVALAVQRYRLGEKSFVSSIFENFKWSIMFIIMFSGMSLHVSQALLCHMFSINMQWGATAKEVTATNFFVEVPIVFKKFKYSMGLSLFGIVAMIVMAVGPLPWSWNIDKFVAIFPLAILCACHILLPIVLNPGLMTFKW